MAWFKVDDGFWSHPKVMLLSDSAVALWVKAGAYSCQHLTDGEIPAPLLRFLGTEQAAEELVQSGLWIVSEQGFRFHDWGEYQETSGEVKRRRDQARERQRKRRAMRDIPRDSTGSNENVTRDTPRDSRVSSQKVSTPDPTRPDPTRPVEVKDLSDSGESDESASEPKPKKTRHEYSPEFEEFWKAWPNARGASKFETSKKFTAALKAADAETIIAGTRRFANDPNLEIEFCPMPTTWLNKRRWEAGPLPARRQSSPQQPQSTSHRFGTRPEDWGPQSPAAPQQPDYTSGHTIIDNEVPF